MDWIRNSPLFDKAGGILHGEYSTSFKSNKDFMPHGNLQISFSADGTSFDIDIGNRTQVFLCGAILGCAGRNLVLYMSQTWGGLKRRIPLFDNILAYVFPASPKLPSELTPAPA